jgi:hypothetical protein
VRPRKKAKKESQERQPRKKAKKEGQEKEWSEKNSGPAMKSAIPK